MIFSEGKTTINEMRILVVVVIAVIWTSLPLALLSCQVTKVLVQCVVVVTQIDVRLKRKKINSPNISIIISKNSPHFP